MNVSPETRENATKMKAAMRELARQYDTEGTHGSARNAAILRNAADELTEISLGRLYAILKAAG